MPGRLRVRSGNEVVRVLEGFGFQRVATRGSHVKLSRSVPVGARQVLHLPLHRSLKGGTLRAIFRQASRFIDAEALRPHFYTD